MSNYPTGFDTLTNMPYVPSPGATGPTGPTGDTGPTGPKGDPTIIGAPVTGYVVTYDGAQWVPAPATGYKLFYTGDYQNGTCTPSANIKAGGAGT